MSFWHKHRWQVVASQEGLGVRLVMPGVHYPVTQVLLRCDCGEVRTKLLDGHWTLAQLSQDGGTISAKAIAKELGVKL